MTNSLSLLQKIDLLAQQPDWPKFLYLGDCGVDQIDQQIRPGGCALNVSYYLNSLKEKVDVLTWIGDDSKSEIVLKTLKEIGANKDGVHQLIGQTPTQYVSIQANGEKKFEAYEAGVLGGARVSADDKNFIDQHQVLITLCYSQIVDLFNQVVEVDFAGIKVVDFMNMADFNFDINFVKKYANWFDIALFGLNQNQTELIDQVKTLSMEHGKLCIVTLGDAGSKVFWGEQEYFQPTTATQIVDTTGCGDAFLAGFLSKFIQSQNVGQAMEFGSNLAAQASTYVGAIPVK